MDIDGSWASRAGNDFPVALSTAFKSSIMIDALIEGAPPFPLISTVTPAITKLIPILEDEPDG
ncbi:hypothetical protein CVM73_38580 [Bradyrhizobium forestalis]|uniref:Uncharacterized protein n=1 Tax=Bradyrhizobium forestalis TaxID=1419263 RepID=A0A2M8QWS3_9BRAD|nr:hypothetical protein CVM73_38580 [Bradyrhizobium forestalis]